MSIVVTGATGQLGRLVVEDLLKRQVPAAEIVATGRNVAAIQDLADRGVRVTQIDYTEPDSLRTAFAGADKLLLISGSEVGQRLAQHRNAIAAAVEADVSLLAYTSILRADTSSLQLAAEHRATEELLAESGLPVTILRNSWYIEVYTAHLPTFLHTGVISGSAGNGRISGATRADYAGAAATVLTSSAGQAGQVYELGGDEAFTMTELAKAVSIASGRSVEYRDLPSTEYVATLIGAGLPRPVAEVVADADRGVAAGELYVDSGDLSRLLGRSTTPLAEAVSTAAQAVRTDA